MFAGDRPGVVQLDPVAGHAAARFDLVDLDGDRPQSFAAPFVGLVVVVNAPVPSGQRPYVVPACGVHE